MTKKPKRLEHMTLAMVQGLRRKAPDMPDIPALGRMERDADRLLVSFTGKVLHAELLRGRQAGRHGWWRNEVVTEEHLRRCAVTALNEGNWRAALVYSAMLTARETIDGPDAKPRKP